MPFNRPTRFIPAYAGNSLGPPASSHAGPVHPRLRGELAEPATKVLLTSGSSPLTRGTREILRNTLADARFIPAYAGNSSLETYRSCPYAVHPRLRGELGRMNFVVNRLRRFIPAYAGNSLKQGIEHLTNSSKDFLSGKYAKNPETVLNHSKNSSLD